MSEDQAIQVNFGKPMPLFPLDHVTLLPQQLMPFHIFEPRYRQMVEHALDGAGQIAMAVFKGEHWKQQYHGRPQLRPAVCIGQIVQHEPVEGGLYNILLHGVCRARIIRELPPEQGRLYRVAYLEPVGLSPPQSDDMEAMEGEPMVVEDAVSPALGSARERIREMLSEGPLTRFRDAEPILELVRDTKYSTSAVLEVISFTLISDHALKYRLLAEPHAESRAEIILTELEHLSSLVKRAEGQHPESWPKGCSWN